MHQAGTRDARAGLLRAGRPRATSTSRSVARDLRTRGMPVTDIVAGTDIGRPPAYLEALRAALDGAAPCSWPSPTCCPPSSRR